jgi:hypothetical protein
MADPGRSKVASARRNLKTPRQTLPTKSHKGFQFSLRLFRSQSVPIAPKGIFDDPKLMKEASPGEEGLDAGAQQTKVGSSNRRKDSYRPLTFPKPPLALQEDRKSVKAPDRKNTSPPLAEVTFPRFPVTSARSFGGNFPTPIYTF